MPQAVEAGEKTAHGVGGLDYGYYGEVRGVKSREDVIKGLECHKRAMYGEIDEHGFACNSCPYKDMESTCRSRTEGDLISDALALLKAQEPVEPEPKEVIYDDEHRSVYCPSCDNRLAGLTYSGAVALETEETPNYCWMCGQVVKW